MRFGSELLDMRAHRLGRWGEWWAECYLRRAGFEVLARNLVTPFAEVDRVCLDGRWLVICEIKTRRVEPERWLGPVQESRLGRAADWLHAEHRRPGTAVRVDLVKVLFRPPLRRFDWRSWVPEIRHERAISAKQV